MNVMEDGRLRSGGGDYTERVWGADRQRPKRQAGLLVQGLSAIRVGRSGGGEGEALPGLSKTFWAGSATGCIRACHAMLDAGDRPCISTGRCCQKVERIGVFCLSVALCMLLICPKWQPTLRACPDLAFGL